MFIGLASLGVVVALPGLHRPAWHTRARDTTAPRFLHSRVATALPALPPGRLPTAAEADDFAQRVLADAELSLRPQVPSHTHVPTTLPESMRPWSGP